MGRLGVAQLLAEEQPADALEAKQLLQPREEERPARTARRDRRRGGAVVRRRGGEAVAHPGGLVVAGLVVAEAAQLMAAVPPVHE